MAHGLVLVGQGLDRGALLRDQRALERALAELREPVAVDTEFHAEHRYRPRLMLVQICGAGGEPLLVDARAGLDLRPLGRALSGRRLLLHAPTRDLQLLSAASGLVPGEVLDTQTLAGFAGLGFPRSLSDLLQLVLGQEPELGATLSDWSRRPLSHDQLRYAAADVRHLHALSQELLAHLDAERRRWLTEACAELVASALREESPEQAWRRIQAARILRGPALGVLRRLAAWREERAVEQNQPRWHVASDAVLVDLARRRPSCREELLGNRKFPRRLARAHGEELLRICAASEPEPEPLALGRRVLLEAYVKALAEQRGADLGVAADLLVPPRHVEGWVSWLEASAQGDDRPVPVNGWRLEALGELMSRFVTGEKVLGFKDLVD